MRSGVVLAALLLMGLARFACTPFDASLEGLDGGRKSGDGPSGPSADAGGPFCNRRPAGTVVCAEFDDVRSLNEGCSPLIDPGGTLVVDAGVLLASVSTDGGGGGAYLLYQFSPTADHVHVEALVRPLRIGDSAVSPLRFTNNSDGDPYRELALYVRSSAVPYIQYQDGQSPTLNYLLLLPMTEVWQSHRYGIDVRFLEDGGAPLLAVSVDGQTVRPFEALRSSWPRDPLSVQVGVASKAKDSAFEVDDVLITVE